MKPPRVIHHCRYCKRQLLDHKADRSHGRAKLSPTRDHVVPQHAGGRKKVRCCRQCNQLKGGLGIEVWRRVMADYPKWWKRFATNGEIVALLRIERRARPAVRVARFPFAVPPAPLCRGLAASPIAKFDAEAA